MRRTLQKVTRISGTAVRAAVVFLVLRLILPPPAAFAFRADGHRAAMRVRGDFLEVNHEKNIVVIKGHAYIEFGDMKLWADSIQGHLDRHQVQAQGNVKFWRSDERLEGHFLVYNYKTKRGRITELRTKRGPNFIKAERMQIEPFRLRAWGVFSTTCDHNPPHFFIKAKDMVIYPKDRMVLHNVALVMGGRVRMRFPNYVVNLKRADRSNRLYISPGYSASKGFSLKSAYSFYFSPRAFGRAYFQPSQEGDHKWGVEFRYEPDKRASGTVNYSAYKSNTLDQVETRLTVTHRQKLSKTSTLDIDAHLTALDRQGTGMDKEFNLTASLGKSLRDWDLTLEYKRRIDLDGDRYTGDNIIQSIDATPRFTFRQKRPHNLFGSSLGMRVDGLVERIREQSLTGNKTSWKEEIAMNFTPRPISIGNWSKWSWNFRELLSFYGADFRRVFGLNVNTNERYGKNWSTSLAYSLQRVDGESPFSTYDILTEQNRLTAYLRYSRPERFSATLFQASFDLDKGRPTAASSNLVFRNPSRDPINWSLGITTVYDLGQDPEGLSEMKVGSISANYRIQRRNAWRHSLITNYDMRNHRISSIAATNDFLISPTVRFQTSANFSHDLIKNNLDLTRLNIALVKDLHCWEGRIRWDVEQREAFIEFYLKASARRKFSLGVDYESDLRIDPQLIDGERPDTSFSSF